MVKPGGESAVAQGCSSVSELYFFVFVKNSFTPPSPIRLLLLGGNVHEIHASSPTVLKSEQVSKSQENICSADEKWGVAGCYWADLRTSFSVEKVGRGKKIKGEAWSSKLSLGEPGRISVLIIISLSFCR